MGNGPEAEAPHYVAARTLEEIAALAGGSIGAMIDREAVTPATVHHPETQRLYVDNPGHIPYLDN